MNQNLYDVELLLDVGILLVCLNILDEYDDNWTREVVDVYYNLKRLTLKE